MHHRDQTPARRQFRTIERTHHRVLLRNLVHDPNYVITATPGRIWCLARNRLALVVPCRGVVTRTGLAVVDRQCCLLDVDTDDLTGMHAADAHLLPGDLDGALHPDHTIDERSVSGRVLVPGRQIGNGIVCTGGGTDMPKAPYPSLHSGRTLPHPAHLAARYRDRRQSRRLPNVESRSWLANPNSLASSPPTSPDWRGSRIYRPADMWN